MNLDRRKLLWGIGGLSGALIPGVRASIEYTPEPGQEKAISEGMAEVTAIEDLMREHGVLRRALFVYSEAAARLRKSPSDFVPEAIYKTAKLFRTFGEDYHEKELEESYIFPAVKQTGGPAAGLVDILIAQHQRGRELTHNILVATEAAIADADRNIILARTMEAFVRMYRPHAAREDTIVFSAWKQTLTVKQFDEMNDRFEDIEHKQFGRDGFEKAVRQISEIEQQLNLTDLAQFTAPPAM